MVCLELGKFNRANDTFRKVLPLNHAHTACSHTNCHDLHLFCIVRRALFGGSGFVHRERKTPSRVLFAVFSSCSEVFLRHLWSNLRQCGVKGGSLIFSRKAFRLQFSTNDSILLYQLMYSGDIGKLFLPRKKIVFEKYINMRERP